MDQRKQCTGGRIFDFESVGWVIHETGEKVSKVERQELESDFTGLREVEIMKFEEIVSAKIGELAEMYVETFNAPPWNDKWTIETASKRIQQMINCEDFYGLIAYDEAELCGMILGSEEQFYDGKMFNLKEFCVKNGRRNQGLGKKIYAEFEKRLKERHVDKIILFTLKDEGVETFYLRRGFYNHSKMIMMGKDI